MEFKGMTVAEFIALLSTFPQDAIIESGNERHFTVQHEKDPRYAGHIHLDYLPHTDKTSNQSVVLWSEE